MSHLDAAKKKPFPNATIEVAAFFPSSGSESKVDIWLEEYESADSIEVVLASDLALLNDVKLDILLIACAASLGEGELGRYPPIKEEDNDG